MADLNSMGIRGEIGRLIQSLMAQADLDDQAAEAAKLIDRKAFQSGKAMGLRLAIAELAALRVRL